jgi:tRNA/tmRNA/rRNA uracil-C5-methylase (TrmA/RlmC/RlmD family)
MGSGSRTAIAADAAGAEGFPSVPPPGRALANSQVSAASLPHAANGFQRAVGALRLALPLVQRLLPLLDGNVATSLSNFLTPQPPPAPAVNLTHIEESLTGLEAGQRALRDQVVEQNSSLKRVEDQLEMVREATDRNTLEQQELIEDLKAVGNKVNAFAFFALALLGISILLNVILYLHIRRVLP